MKKRARHRHTSRAALMHRRVFFKHGCVPANQRCIVLMEACLVSTQHRMNLAGNRIQTTHRCVVLTDGCIKTMRRWLKTTEGCVSGRQRCFPETQVLAVQALAAGAGVGGVFLKKTPRAAMMPLYSPLRLLLLKAL